MSSDIIQYVSFVLDKEKLPDLTEFDALRERHQHLMRVVRDMRERGHEVLGNYDLEGKLPRDLIVRCNDNNITGTKELFFELTRRHRVDFYGLGSVYLSLFSEE